MMMKAGILVVSGVNKEDFERISAEFELLPPSGAGLLKLPPCTGVITFHDPTNDDPTLSQFYKPDDDPDSEVWRNMRIDG